MRNFFIALTEDLNIRRVQHTQGDDGIQAKPQSNMLCGFTMQICGSVGLGVMSVIVKKTAYIGDRGRAVADAVFARQGYLIIRPICRTFCLGE